MTYPANLELMRERSESKFSRLLASLMTQNGDTKIKWYLDRFIGWVMIVVVAIFVLPFKYIGGALIFIGEKVDYIGDFVISTKVVRKIDLFMEKHEIDTNIRKASKKSKAS